ncbi:MAG: class I SAM-dependent methyltransferase [Bdellovibrionota bacterium]
MNGANRTFTDKPVALVSYENFGEAYATAIEKNGYNALFERPSTLALLPDLKGKKVLDAGCGPGAYTGLLLERQAIVTGIDVSPSMLKIAKEKFGAEAKYILHDLGQPLKMFQAGQFDFILSSLMIHYINDLNALFAEFNRILSPGDRIVLSTHHPMMDFNESVNQLYYQKELLSQDWTVTGQPVKVHFYRRPLSEVTQAFTSNGFVIERMTEGTVGPELKKTYPHIADRLSKKPQFLFFRLLKV